MPADTAFQLLELARQLPIRFQGFAQIYEARMIAMLTCTARSLLSTLDSMATPCSVKA